MRSQALGLAEAIGLPFVEKRIAVPRTRWRALRDLLAPTHEGLDPSGDRLEPPWPRLLIACGRRSVGPAIAVRRAAVGATRVIYIQDPMVSPRHFDLVVPMRHDGLRGANVFSVDTALHRIRPTVLIEAAALGGRLKGNAPLLLGVLLGGSTRGTRARAGSGEALGRLLRHVHARSGARVVLTPSRRTGDAVRGALLAELGDAPWYEQWDGEEPNPLLGILAGADRLIVSGDSVSMVSEALATGRPVHVLPEDRPSRRRAAFVEALRRRGLISLLEGDDLDWSHASPGPVDATPGVAAEVARRFLVQPS
jgi:mitochondrial fission protein ELM1